jgi:hypothetical protein
MNRKQFVILLVLVLVLGGVGLKYYSRNAASWSGGGAAIGQKLLGDLDVNAVAQISVKQGADELLLAKKQDRWCVAQRGDYPAKFSDMDRSGISDLLLKLKDLKVGQSETVGPSQLGRLELATSGTNAATVLELRDAGGKPIKSLLLGKKHLRKTQGSPMGDMDDGGWPDGRYVMVGGATDKVSLISDPLANVEPKPENWLNKDFFKVEKARSIVVTFQNETNSWKLEREKEGAELKLADAKPGEELDNGKISGMANPFSSPTFVDVIMGAKPGETGLEKPTMVKIETFDGFTYDIKVGTKTNENYYLTMAVAGNFPKERAAGTDEKPEDKAKLDKEFADNLKKLGDKLAQEKAFESWTFLAAGWPVDSVVKERGQLFAEKKPDENKEAAEPLPGTIPGASGTP